MGGEDRRARDVQRFVENFEDMAAHLRPDDPVPDVGGIEGADESGTIYCVVDVGGTLSQVGIVDGWWDAVGPGHVAAAILDAMRFAKSKATMARLILDRYGHPYRAPVSDAGTLFAAAPSEPLPPYESDDFNAALARKLDRTMTILSNAERFSRAADSPERRVVTGPRGMFSVVLSGFEIVRAEVNEYGLGPSDGPELAADARDALLAARPSLHAQGEAR
jgi:hypothetical protein